MRLAIPHRMRSRTSDFSRLAVGALGAVSAVMLACAQPAPTDGPASVQSPPAGNPTTTKSNTETTSGCPENLPFEVSYLPRGFSRRSHPGPAPGARPPDSKGQAIVHFRGPRERAIEIRRPATLFAELAMSDDRRSLLVLGHRTSNIGPVEPGGQSHIIQFRYRSKDAAPGCHEYSLNEYGVKIKDLIRVAEGLRADG